MQTHTVTPEITLAIRSIEDAERTLQLINSNRAYLRNWLPWVDNVLTVEDCKQFIEQNIFDFQHGKGATYGIYYTGELVGLIGFHFFDKANRKTIIGYWLAKEYTGKGIMSKCVQYLTHDAFTRLELYRVEIHCAVGNGRSSAIPKRLGFTYEGTLRQDEWLYDHFVDVEVYSKLSTD